MRGIFFKNKEYFRLMLFSYSSSQHDNNCDGSDNAPRTQGPTTLRQAELIRQKSCQERTNQNSSVQCDTRDSDKSSWNHFRNQAQHDAGAERVGASERRKRQEERHGRSAFRFDGHDEES